MFFAEIARIKSTTCQKFRLQLKIPRPQYRHMRSELQSQTSRRNGAKSRGPKTAAGKANSSQNALTHGVLSRTIVIAGEDASRFSALLASLRAHLHPNNCVEDSLVEDLATCRWRQRRLLAMETACLTEEIERQVPEDASRSNAARAASALNHLAANTHGLDLINRYELRFDRQYNRTLHRLFAIRREPQPQAPPAGSPCQESDSFHSNPANQ